MVVEKEEVEEEMVEEMFHFHVFQTQFSPKQRLPKRKNSPEIEMSERMRRVPINKWRWEQN